MESEDHNRNNATGKTTTATESSTTCPHKIAIAVPLPRKMLGPAKVESAHAVMELGDPARATLDPNPKCVTTSTTTAMEKPTKTSHKNAKPYAIRA